MDRPKMSRQDRAKQFMPFAALRGLAEAIKEAEREMVDNCKPVCYTPYRQKRTGRERHGERDDT